MAPSTSNCTPARPGVVNLFAGARRGDSLVSLLNKIGKDVVTQQMVADAAGVHLSTVSLALQNAPRLPEATKRRIREVAAKLHYRPNPLVSLLMARVRRRNAAYRGTLAFVHTAPDGAERLRTHQHRNFLSGARTRAVELGYKLDEFFLPAGRAGGNQFVTMLRTRGIPGVVIEHVPGVSCLDRKLPFDIAPFAAASLGMPLAAPALHYVANDQYMRPVLAARQLLDLGYRRIGLVLDDTFDRLMSHRCSAGFWAVQRYASGLAVLPIFHLQDARGAGLRGWLTKHRPDAVLGTSAHALELILATGRKVPDDLGWAHLDWLPEYQSMAGVYGNSEHTGVAAVELVVSQLHRGESGPPVRAMNYLVAGSWVPGETVRRIGPAADLDTTFFGEFGNL